MSSNDPTLHLVCGKIAAGKSTLAARLGAAPRTVVIGEDAWLASLYPAEMARVADYVRCSARLRQAMGPHVIGLLNAELSVVLDFPANTLASRAWMRRLFEVAGVAHQLHYLDVPDDVCRARLRARNAGGKHPFAVSDEQFDHITSQFLTPSPAEGFDVSVYRAS